MPLLAFHGDYDFSFVTPFSEVTERFGHFAQLIGSVDNRNELTGLDKLLQICQTFVWSLRHQTKLSTLTDK